MNRFKRPTPNILLLHNKIKDNLKWLYDRFSISYKPYTDPAWEGKSITIKFKEV